MHDDANKELGGFRLFSFVCICDGWAGGDITYCIGLNLSSLSNLTKRINGASNKIFTKAEAATCCIVANNLLFYQF